ncbi:hypothetical protein ILUMI_21837, partial [Ignelater luminosus]
INVDGLPISKSSNKQLWPIQACIFDKEYKYPPFLIGCYYGNSKPRDANEFLQLFANEIPLFKEFCLNGKLIIGQIRAIICDVPAKSFITYTKGHTGYHACGKCIQEGKFVNNRMTFPECDALLRSDENFKNKTYEDHHTGTLILQSFANMVTQMPLDYQHLVLHGVTKKLLLYWTKGPLPSRLNSRQIKVLNENLISMQMYIPSEFCRKPRSIYELDRWKATELRLFLLYIGPIVLKKVLPDDKSGELYSSEFLTYNVHNLVHINVDVLKYGALDNFSTFKFENNMMKIKKYLKKRNKPLEQLNNRISEENLLHKRSDFKIVESSPVL